MFDIDWINYDILQLKDGEPCSHIGCLQHVSHPCEGCGRIGGIYLKTIEQAIADTPIGYRLPSINDITNWNQK